MTYTELFCFHFSIIENDLQNEKGLIKRDLEDGERASRYNWNKFTSLGHTRLHLRMLKELADIISEPQPVIAK